MYIDSVHESTHEVRMIVRYLRQVFVDALSDRVNESCHVVIVVVVVVVVVVVGERCVFDIDSQFCAQRWARFHRCIRRR